MPDTTDEQLLAVLATIRQRGPIGEASLVEAIRRADAFVVRIPLAAATAIDLGSGGGLPALVITVRRPDLTVTMVERRTTRADLLRRAVASLGAGARCRVVTDDAEVVAAREAGTAEVVTARSFAAPAITARIGAALLRPGGRLLVAEPPEIDPDRWPSTMIDRLGLADLGRYDGVRVFERFT
jgi:16S rRNA (guanine527-N7)-methyltransferase